MHKESGQLLAIKQVPVDADLQDIIKEISIMQQCDRSAISTFALISKYPLNGNSIQCKFDLISRLQLFEHLNYSNVSLHQCINTYVNE